jgi:hypothetical protein
LELGVALRRHVDLLTRSALREVNQIGILPKAIAVLGLPGGRLSDFGSDEPVPKLGAGVDTSSSYMQVEQESDSGLVEDDLRTSR